MNKIEINANKVVNYKPREERSINLSTDERDYYKQGFNVLHKKTKSENCSGGYYRAIIEMFSGNQAKYFLSVITRLETDYKGYQMPTLKEFGAVLNEIKRDEQTEERLKAPRLEYDTTLSDDEQGEIHSMVDDWCKKHK